MEAHTPSFIYVTNNTVKYSIYDTKTVKSYCVYQVEQIFFQNNNISSYLKHYIHYVNKVQF